MHNNSDLRTVLARAIAMDIVVERFALVAASGVPIRTTALVPDSAATSPVAPTWG